MRMFKSLFGACKLISILIISLGWLSKMAASQNQLQISPEPQDDYIEKDLSTQLTKRNFVVRRALERSILGHKTDLYSLFSKANQNAKGLPPMIFDYANMIQNDIFLDDSVETSKRGIATIPSTENNMYGPLDTRHSCDCELKGVMMNLGPHHYPQRVPHKICKPDSSCSALFQCQPIIYNIRVLKKFDLSIVPKDLPESLQADWSFKKVPVTVACVCSNPDPQ